MKDEADNVTAELSALGQAAAEPAAEPAAPARGRGRPRVYSSAAERQKAYRARQKAAGLRVVAVVVRDVRDGTPLRSGVIDLSEVRRW